MPADHSAFKLEGDVPRLPDLSVWLQHTGKSYCHETALLKTVWLSSGYHSHIPGGSIVHETRRSAYYALGLLMEGKDLCRGNAILEALCTLQDQDPSSKTYGIWPYCLEESLEEMAPPDWNWADFLGAVLATVLRIAPTTLAPQTEACIREALRHACCAITRRDSPLHYTNIAIMGAGVCTLAGELLSEPDILDYGRGKLQRLVAYTKETHCTFPEYNSPTYTMIALEELERILLLSMDTLAREAAESLRSTAWQIIADHFHVATGQWAGPHARVYADFLPAVTAARLSRRTGHDIRTPAQSGREYVFAFQDFLTEEATATLACPDNLAERFFTRSPAVRDHTQVYLRIPSAPYTLVGGVTFDDEACLASISEESLWTQRRPLLGYWKCPGGVACFRPRFLKDGRDFASAMLRVDRRGLSALTTFGFIRNGGDYHLFLDCPTDQIFPYHDLRIRFQLTASEARVVDVASSHHILAAGDWAVDILTLPGSSFEGKAASLQTGFEPGLAWVDLVLDPNGGQLNLFASPSILASAAVGLRPLQTNHLPIAKPVLHDSQTASPKVSWSQQNEYLVSHVPMRPVHRLDSF